VTSWFVVFIGFPCGSLQKNGVPVTDWAIYPRIVRTILLSFLYRTKAQNIGQSKYRTPGPCCRCLYELPCPVKVEIYQARVDISRPLDCQVRGSNPGQGRNLKTEISASHAPQWWWRRVTRAGWGQL